MAVLLTGDGGWAPADRALAAAVAARGVPVVGLDSRAYLTHGQTVERLGADMRRILRHYSDAWQRAQVIVIGYSRGADMAPFMVSRLPDDLRRRVVLVSLLGPGERTSFKFHWPDLVLSVPEDANIPVRPEIEKLRGLPMQCIYGSKDGSAICPKLDPALAQVIVREGHGHRILSDEAGWLATTILGGAKSG
jgi:type IV secretory pathway VirJ component